MATGPSIDVRDLHYEYPQAISGSVPLALSGASFQVRRGARVLIVGGNGAGKSTLLSILGGRKLIPEQRCHVLQREVFHDHALHKEVCYLGDWWKGDFHLNITVREMLGDNANEERVQRIADVLGVDLSWILNRVSDGMRRRSQILIAMAVQKQIYLLDEATTDMDVVARERFLQTLKEESERGATILYATHIFDNLDRWATDIMRLKQGRVAGIWPLESCPDYVENKTAGKLCPLYVTISAWIWEDWEDVRNAKGEQKQVSNGGVH